jgi:kynurenine formamidase
MVYCDDMVTGWFGVGTQLDSLAHLGIDNTFYNGNQAKDFVRTTGVTKLGVEKIPPFVTRAVLVDLAKAKNKPRLDGGELVTADELRAAVQAQNVRVTPGDVVVLHTGWLSMIEQDPRRFGNEEPGIDAAGAEYLASLQPLAVGADTWGVEAVPFRNPKVIWQGHRVLLAQNGIYILENLDTRELVRDNVTEFMFVLGQPLYRGAVRGIINPIAIR